MTPACSREGVNLDLADHLLPGSLLGNKDHPRLRTRLQGGLEMGIGVKPPLLPVDDLRQNRLHDGQGGADSSRQAVPSLR